jgi:hypothetical protein
MSLGAFLSPANLKRIFGRGKEGWAVVTELTLVAPDKLKKENPTPSVQPSQRFSSGAINFMIAAIRTALQSDFMKRGPHLFLLRFLLSAGDLILCWAFPFLIPDFGWRLFSERLQELGCFFFAAIFAVRHEFNGLLWG